MQTQRSHRIEQILFARALRLALEGHTLDTANEIDAMLDEPMEHTHGDFLDRMNRYEAAVRGTHEGGGNGGEEVVKELKAARQSLSDLSRIAKAAFDAKFEAVNDRPMGKALKDWATAIMANRHITRDNARAFILERIKVMTKIENEPVDPMFNIEGCTSGRIQSSEPNFTEVERRAQHEHLPEGSY